MQTVDTLTCHQHHTPAERHTRTDTDILTYWHTVIHTVILLYPRPQHTAHTRELLYCHAYTRRPCMHARTRERPRSARKRVACRNWSIRWSKCICSGLLSSRRLRNSGSDNSSSRSFTRALLSSIIASSYFLLSLDKWYVASSTPYWRSMYSASSGVIRLEGMEEFRRDGCRLNIFPAEENGSHLSAKTNAKNGVESNSCVHMMHK